MATKDPTLTRNELADLLGVSTNTIKSWTDKGAPHDKDGRQYYYNCAAVVEWRIAYERQLVIDELSKGTAGSGSADLVAEKTRLTSAQADLAEYKYLEAQRHLVPILVVMTAWEGLIVAAREVIKRAKNLTDEEREDILHNLRTLPIEDYIEQISDDEEAEDSTDDVEDE